MTEMINVAIIGAGPYGLSVAAHLRKAGIPHVVYGKTVESWREHMPKGMKLRSETFAACLSDPDRRYTLDAYCRMRDIPYRKSGPTLAIETFIDYADWFQRQAVPDIRDQKLVRLARQGDGFSLTFANGDEAFAKSVVLATGHRPFRVMPSQLSGLDAALVSHSDDHDDLSQFAGRDVVVVGGGQSGLEAAALLNELGARPRMLVREDHVVWMDPHLGERSALAETIYPETGLGYGWKNFAIAELPWFFRFLPDATRYRVALGKLGPSGGWWLKERVLGKVPLLTSHEVIYARDVGGAVRLTVRAGDKTFETDTSHVIAATGYKPDVARLAFLDSAILKSLKTYNGMPVLGRACESSVPGLYFAGLLSAFTYGPIMRFIHGTKHAGPMLARRLAVKPELAPDRQTEVARGPAKIAPEH